MLLYAVIKYTSHYSTFAGRLARIFLNPKNSVDLSAPPVGYFALYSGGMAVGKPLGNAFINNSAR